MNRFVRSLASASAALLFATDAGAQADHLQCYKIKDALAKAEYVADITPDDLAFPATPGCTIKTPAKLLCVDAVKSNVMPSPPGAAAGAEGQKYLCYKAKCPKNESTTSLTDQFGTHALSVKPASLVCAPVPEAPAPTCSDMLENGSETDVDCGGGTCPDCGPGQGCLVANDCTTGICTGNLCQSPSCTDTIENGSETDVDCGGGTCPDCNPGQGCFVGNDCTSGVCTAGFCQSPSCSDLVQNGSETGLDCGGGICPTCGTGQGCAMGSDCTSNVCQAGVCVTLSNGEPCSGSGQCTSNNCVDGVCCNSACAATCQACSTAKKGYGSNGTCGNIQAGIDPDSECAGVCDGMGMCTP